MRARYPDQEGRIDRDGVGIHYEVHGDGEPTLVLLPTWSIVHSRMWKMQIPYLARHFRVVAFDGRGNGKSDRPRGPASYKPSEFALDTGAVMDATDTSRAVLVGFSCGTLFALEFGDSWPDRVLGAVFVAPAAPLAPQLEEREVQRRDEIIDDPVEWQKYNIHFWKTDYLDFLGFIMGKFFSEPHSTKQIEDCIAWALETDPDTLAETDIALDSVSARRVIELARRVEYPVMVVHGVDDAVRNFDQGLELARRTGGHLLRMEGTGHAPHARDAVKVNHAIKDFVDRRVLKERAA